MNLCDRIFSFPISNLELFCIVYHAEATCAQNLAQLRQLRLLDLAALHDADSLIIATQIVRLPASRVVAVVLDSDICHYRVFAAIAARENTRCCHGQSHHTSALQEITTSHISHFLAPHKLFCFFLFSFARLRKRQLVCYN